MPDEPSTEPAAERPTPFSRIGADWAAVIVAAILVLLAGLGLLPSIPFLIK